MRAPAIFTSAVTLAILALGAAGSAPAHQTDSASARPAELARQARPRPPVHQHRIPFGAKRRREMRRYAIRHYGIHTYRLRNPQVIVEHFSVTPDLSSLYNTFAPDIPDPELHELPGTCAHFGVGHGGRIIQMVSVKIMCRHTVGLNWTAIGIENVGYSDRQILNDHDQLRASLRLTAWLRCRFGIRIRNVIGHNESLSSPFHHERVRSLRHQTHGDWNHHDMNIYRSKLRHLHC